MQPSQISMSILGGKEAGAVLWCCQFVPFLLIFVSRGAGAFFIALIGFFPHVFLQISFLISKLSQNLP